MKLKAFLMDQTIIAGIGNIYADEILFAAGLRYDRMTDSLSTQEIRRLYRAVVETLHDAIKYGGSTLADEQYVDLNGKPGEYQEHHKVYDRESQPCRRCRRATIVQGQVRRPLHLLLRGLPGLRSVTTEPVPADGPRSRYGCVAETGSRR